MHNFGLLFGQYYINQGYKEYNYNLLAKITETGHLRKEFRLEVIFNTGEADVTKKGLSINNL